MKMTKAGRWVLLGFNLVLATAILAQPGQAESARGGNDCFAECFRGWAGCVLDGGLGLQLRTQRVRAGMRLSHVGSSFGSLSLLTEIT